MLNYHAILPEPLTAMALPAEMKSFRIPFLISSYFENSVCQLLKQTWIDDSDDFFIQFTYINIRSACSLITSPARNHIAASLIYILEGNLSIRENESGSALPRIQGDFYLRSIETRKSSFIIDFTQQRTYQIVYISLSEKKLAGLQQREPLFKNKNIINAREIRKAGAWIKARILEMQQRREPSKDALDRYLIRRTQRLFDAFIHLYDFSSINWRTIKPKERIDNLQTFILNNLGENLSMHSFAEMLHMNKDSLRKSFHLTTGITLDQYIRIVRMKKACQLLKEDQNSSIAKVAEQVGYNSLVAFYAAFEKYTGLSPKKYRKNDEY